MEFLLNLLAVADPLPGWVTTLFPILKKIFLVLMALGALAVITLVLCQQSNSGDGITGVTGGSTDTYYAQNKGKTREGRLKKATTITAICMAVITILYFVLLIVVPNA